MATSVIADRYRLERRLGAGGMSEVWAADDPDLDRTVAIKLLGPDADPVRFEREARAVAGLSHPGIGRLYDYGETEGRPFMVLEYLPGGSLEDRLAGGTRLGGEVVVRIALEVAAGLAHAHDHGLVHRDLKPSNILFDAEGRAKIVDFGIVQLGQSSGLTTVGTVLGTAAYVSPEQGAGEPATPASDVYSFGVIVYRMLAGALPFDARDPLAVVAMHRDAAPPPLARLRPDASPRLESTVMAALSKSPADRPRNGRALLEELRPLGRPTARESTATQVLRPAPKRGRSPNVVVIVVAGLLAVAGVTLALVLTIRGGSAPAPPQTTPADTARATTPE